MEADNGDIATSCEIWEEPAETVIDLTQEGFEALAFITGTKFGTFPIYYDASEFIRFSSADDSISMEIDVDFGI